MSNFSPRARVVAASFVIQGTVIGMMFGYSVFLKVLEGELGWSRTVLSGAPSLAFLVMGLLAFVVGRLSDRYGPRWVLTVSGLSTGVAYALMGGMQEPWQLLLYFGCLVGVGLATHDVVTLSTVATWYQKKRGLMTGVVKTGTAVGQVLVPILVTVLIASVGWRQALVVLGIGAAIILVAVAQMMRRKPAADGPDDATADQSDDNGTQTSGRAESMDLAGPQLTLSAALKSPVLWMLCAIQFCFFPSLTTVPLHIVAHASDLGLSTVRAATVLSMIGGCSIAGRLVVGLLHDRIGGRRALLLCLTLLSLALLALRIIDTPYLLYFLAPFYGFAHGGLFTVVSPNVAEYFGLKAHGAIFGIVVLFGTLSGASGPLLAGWLFDRSGSYSIAFMTLMFMAVISVLLSWFLPRKA